MKIEIDKHSNFITNLYGRNYRCQKIWHLNSKSSGIRLVSQHGVLVFHYPFHDVEMKNVTNTFTQFFFLMSCGWLEIQICGKVLHCFRNQSTGDNKRS